MRFEKFIDKSGNVVWDDGKHHVELPFEHQKAQLANRHPNIAMIVSSLVSVVIGIVSFFRARRRNGICQNDTESGKIRLRE
jgi:hypothetical protein